MAAGQAIDRLLALRTVTGVPQHGEGNTMATQRDEVLTKAKENLVNIMSEIDDMAHEQSKMIKEKRDSLIEECKTYMEELEASGRTGERVGTVVGGQTSAPDSLSTSFQDLSVSARKNAEEIARQCGDLCFIPYKINNILGELGGFWLLEKKEEVNFKGKAAESLAATHDGNMVIGYYSGSVQVYSVDGLEIEGNETEKRRKQDVRVRGAMASFRDGRFAVRGLHNITKLYSQTWEDIRKLDAKTRGGMGVDGSGHIYLGCLDAAKVHVYTLEGGAPVREIPCHGYIPSTVCTMNHSEMLVLSDDKSVRVVNGKGEEIRTVSKEGFKVSVAVLQDDRILIGWKKDDGKYGGRVNIDLYTNQLRHLREVLANNGVQSNVRGIREFSTGEIALCTRSQLHIFDKKKKNQVLSQ